MAKKYRIQRWSPGRDKWIFWLSDVFDQEKLAIAEVQDLNQGREYIREGITFRYVAVLKDKKATNEKQSMLFNPYSKVTKIFDVPPFIDVGST
ncbi:hypothetical protein KAR91_64225 [Candidatus Pacearchaeota archaeon]|nr:hypothetical protein [Candidatus Pacearchaeota archaeon]